MQVFAVFSVSHSRIVRERLQEHYPDQYIEGRQAFFVATVGETSVQVADKLGFGTENLSSGIVIPVTAYWGRADPNLWEWIQVKMDANGK